MNFEEMIILRDSTERLLSKLCTYYIKNLIYNRLIILDHKISRIVI